MKRIQGIVETVNDGVVKISGMEDVGMGGVIRFSGFAKSGMGKKTEKIGLVMSIDSNYVGVLQMVSENIKVGTEAIVKGESLKCKVGPDVLGMVVDVCGEVLDYHGFWFLKNIKKWEWTDVSTEWNKKTQYTFSNVYGMRSLRKSWLGILDSLSIYKEKEKNGMKFVDSKIGLYETGDAMGTFGFGDSYGLWFKMRTVDEKAIWVRDWLKFTANGMFVMINFWDDDTNVNGVWYNCMMKACNYNAFYKMREKEKKAKRDNLGKRWKRKKIKRGFFLHLLEYLGFRKNQMYNYKLEGITSAYVFTDFYVNGSDDATVVNMIETRFMGRAVQLHIWNEEWILFPWVHVLFSLYQNKSDEEKKRTKINEDIKEYDVMPFDMNRLWRDGESKKVQKLVEGMTRATLKEIKGKKKKSKIKKKPTFSVVGDLLKWYISGIQKRGFHIQFAFLSSMNVKRKGVDNFNVDHVKSFVKKDYKYEDYLMIQRLMWRSKFSVRDYWYKFRKVYLKGMLIFIIRGIRFNEYKWMPKKERADFMIKKVPTVNNLMKGNLKNFVRGMYSKEKNTARYSMLWGFGFLREFKFDLDYLYGKGVTKVGADLVGFDIKQILQLSNSWKLDIYKNWKNLKLKREQEVVSERNAESWRPWRSVTEGENMVKSFDENYPQDNWDEVSENMSYEHYFLYEKGVSEAYSSIELGMRGDSTREVMTSEDIYARWDNFSKSFSFMEVSVERRGPGIITRAPVREAMETGLKVVDSMVPIGRGQRELVLGDRQTGKTQIGIDMFLHQAFRFNRIMGSFDVDLLEPCSRWKNGGQLWKEIIGKTSISRKYADLILNNKLFYSNLKEKKNITENIKDSKMNFVGSVFISCMVREMPFLHYVGVGQKISAVNKVVRVFQDAGIMQYVTVILAGAAEMPVFQYVAPFSGCTMAEYWRDLGFHSVIVYDDLSKHANAYRSLSLLLGKPPGREAFPGDVFYLHSRLLERAAQLRKPWFVNTDSVVSSLFLGGRYGSLTALPIVETVDGDLSAYISTNVISITDGQIFLDSSFFGRGIRPAVHPGQSVSRVGSSAQNVFMKKFAGSLKLELANFREVEQFMKFGSSVDKVTMRLLHRGRRLERLMVQRACSPLMIGDQLVMLIAASQGYLDKIEVDQLFMFEKLLLASRRHLMFVGMPTVDNFFLIEEVSLYLELFTDWFLKIVK